MTEAEWRGATDPKPMLEFLKGKTSDRKLRLFANECCRRIARYFKDERSGELVDVSESYADSKLGAADLQAAFEQAAEAQEAVHWEGGNAVDQNASEAVLGLRQELLLEQVFEGTHECVGEFVAGEAWDRIYGTPGKHWSIQDREHNEECAAGTKQEMMAQTKLALDIFGNPFRLVIVDPSWLTSTVAGLAHGIYDDKAYDRMPILADALQDAGCENADILDHCRSEGPHVRGCWVVDLLTGRS